MQNGMAEFEKSERLSANHHYRLTEFPGKSSQANTLQSIDDREKTISKLRPSDLFQSCSTSYEMHGSNLKRRSPAESPRTNNNNNVKLSSTNYFKVTTLSSDGGMHSNFTDDGTSSSSSEDDKHIAVQSPKKRKASFSSSSSTVSHQSPQRTSAKDGEKDSKEEGLPPPPPPPSSSSKVFEFHSANLMKSSSLWKNNGAADYHLPKTTITIHRGDSHASTSKCFSNVKLPLQASSFVNSPDEENEQEENGIVGSELLVAAYNNFVRKLVDETLDRSITFCEQPRHAISALERICSKAWPQLESKRHRNRIRAYLKACRRNSKKNRGQINMKEPPMNGLSVEARQMVTSALALVAKDVEQLRQDLKKDQISSVFNSKNGVPSPHKPETSSYFASPTSCSSSSTRHYESGFQPHAKQVTPRNPYHEDKIQQPLLNTSVSSKVNTNSSTSLSSSFEGPDCMATMMRLFPTAFQLSSAFGSDFGASIRLMQAALMHPPPLPLPQESHNVLNHSSPHFRGNSGRSTHEGGGKHGSVRDKSAAQSTATAPPAHFATAKYSPTLNEATSRLLDVRPLTQDDLAYFQHYQNIMNEALEYIKGVSQMLLKKAEILEGHFRTTRSSLVHTPLNYSSNL